MSESLKWFPRGRRGGVVHAVPELKGVPESRNSLCFVVCREWESDDEKQEAERRGLRCSRCARKIRMMESGETI